MHRVNAGLTSRLGAYPALLYLSSVMSSGNQEVALVDEFQVLSIIATAIRSGRSDKQNLEEAKHEAKAVLLALANAGLTIVPASKD